MKKLKIFILKNLKWIILFIGVIIFLVILQSVFAKEIMQGDIIGYNFISKYLISDKITPIAKFITNLGGATVLIAITIILFMVIKNKKIGLSIAINLASIALLNQILKNIVQRPRPTEYRIIEESGYSFPSGHSMVSMAFYGFLIYLILKYIKNKKIKPIAITFLILIILLIGISRIYLGVHYTSDVIAGFDIAVSYLIVYTSIIDKFVLGELKVSK